MERGIGVKKQMGLKNQIEKYSDELNDILGRKNINILDLKVLKMSEDLDELIVQYYKERMDKNKMDK
ncbi:Spo0E like sporulation regulatory protein [Tepidibacter formicigenes DSM 15518]|uniref:Spo0E like sporulation regulatory protein n=1 Tax=Tepidibacter formicigenes DSM 15518 TaxID=1123349 RepID=A0A1M6L9L8_9FIRM|nr:Spo0E like sporulation regulatory protein [Tepidibacter formicigenes DSM 15518]